MQKQRRIYCDRFESGFPGQPISLQSCCWSLRMFALGKAEHLLLVYNNVYKYFDIKNNGQHWFSATASYGGLLYEENCHNYNVRHGYVEFSLVELYIHNYISLFFLSHLQNSSLFGHKFMA